MEGLDLFFSLSPFGQCSSQACSLPKQRFEDLLEALYDMAVRVAYFYSNEELSLIVF